MTTNAIGSSARASLGSEVAGTNTGISPAQNFLWAVRRELWEYRMLYLGPLAATGLFLAAFAVSTLHFARTMRLASALGAIRLHDSIASPYDMIAGLTMLTMMIVGAFYCLDALYGERRDRSVLFWKSMPVSDTVTVLAKASIPFVVLPLLVWAIAVVAQFLMLILSSGALAASGQSVGELWHALPLPRMFVLLLYHLIMAHVLWHAPFYAWLLLVGAWARRTPFVWAVLPPIALCFIEKIVFNTTYFLDMLRYRLNGNGMDVLLSQNRFPIDPMTQMTPVRYLGSLGLWTGLAVTVAFLWVATWLRRNRGPV
ncbi:MAG TPA: hypothetical protein VMI10_13255 [Terriglobales bacterium]|nr:hypothetical protein [Terriglobales bacterium]